MERKFLALDTETTGMDPEKDRIIELYIAEVTYPDLKEQEWLEHRFDPGIPIPAEATKLHGIRDEDVQKHSPFSHVASWLQEKLEGACIIAYNGRFDVRVLNAELKRAGQKGLPATVAVLDPYELFKEDFPRTLSDAVRYYMRRPHKTAHSARGDVHAMLKVLRRQLLRRDPQVVLERAIKSTRLDYDGRFILDEEGQVRLNFGKHKGSLAREHRSYLQWVLAADFPQDVKLVAGQVLSDCSDPKHERHASERLPGPRRWLE